MSFFDLITGAHSLIMDTFSDEVHVTIHFPSSTSFGEITVRAIPERSPMQQDALPAPLTGNSASSLYLFIQLSSLPDPANSDPSLIRGSTATITKSSIGNNGDYDVIEALADRLGAGASLQLRKRSRPWNA